MAGGGVRQGSSVGGALGFGSGLRRLAFGADALQQDGGGFVVGVLGHKLTGEACLRMLWRRRSARLRLASTVASACWMTDIWRSTSATMRCCSARGGRGMLMLKRRLMADISHD